MTSPPSLPPLVRCNCGFGWTFGIIVGMTGVVAVAGALANPGEGSLGRLQWPIVCASVLALFLVVHATLLPHLKFDVARGFIRTRWRNIPYTAIGEVRFTHYGRAGIWADIIGDDGKRLARMSIAGTLFAAANVEQWLALRHALYSAAHLRGTRTAQRRNTPENWGPIGGALRVLDAQVAWCLSENRPNASDAPWRGLINTPIVVR